MGQHIGSVFGYEITRASMISSSVNTLLYCASGFSAECSWFFSRDLGELLEADAVVLVGVLHAGLAEHRGHRAGAEPAVDGHDAAVATRRLVDFLAPLAPRCRPSRPILPICSAPMARPKSALPAWISTSAVRTAVAPVAHALTTL